MAGTPNGLGPRRGPPWVEYALLVAVAAAVRTVGVNGSLWLDELFTAWVVLGTEGTLAERAAIGNAAAPYYWLVKASVTLFGPAEWAIRLPSLAFGAAVPVAVYILARALSGSAWSGRVAGLLVALDGTCSAYASEARPYSLLQFFGALQLLTFWTLLHGGSGRWRFAFVLTTITMGYLHFVGLAVVAGEIAYYALLRLHGERPGYTLGRFVLDLSIAGVALLPLVPLVLAILGRKANFDISAKPVGLEDLVILHRQPAYLILPFVAAAVVAFARRPTAEAARAWVAPLAFALIVFYATVGPLWAAHRAGGPTLFRVRYTMVPYLLPLVAAGVATVAWQWRWACIAFGVTAILLGQMAETPARRISAGGSPRLTHDDWRGPVAWVNERAAPSTPVFVFAGWIETDSYLSSDNPVIRDYLISPVRTVYALTHPDRTVRPLTFKGDLVGEADAELIRTAGEAWFIVNDNESHAKRAAASAVGRLTGNGRTAEVTDRKAFRNVVAFRIRLVPTPDQPAP